MSRLRYLCLFAAGLFLSSLAAALGEVGEAAHDIPPGQRSRLVSEHNNEYDGLGATDGLVNDRGSVTDRWLYRAFGQAAPMKGSNNSRFTFVEQKGNRWDSRVRAMSIPPGIMFCRTGMLNDEAIRLRLAIMRAALDTKVEYGDHRNPRFWEEKQEVFYPLPEMPATEALLDIGRERDDRGRKKDRRDALYCTPLAQILLMQGHIALATPVQRQAWDFEWKNLVQLGAPVPNEIPGVGESRFWIRSYAEDELGAVKGVGYAASDLLPGDNIYFENPYFTNEMVELDRYRGEEGSNVFFLGTRTDGEGVVFHPYSGKVYTFTGYRQHMIDDWASIIDTSGGSAKPAMFKITHKRSPIVTP